MTQSKTDEFLQDVVSDQVSLYSDADFIFSEEPITQHLVDSEAKMQQFLNSNAPQSIDTLKPNKNSGGESVPVIHGFQQVVHKSILKGKVIQAFKVSSTEPTSQRSRM